MSSPIHIGSIIRDELRRQGKTNNWFAKEINVNPRTVNKIFGLLVKKVHKIVGVLTYWSKLVHKYQFFPTFITSI